MIQPPALRPAARRFGPGYRPGGQRAAALIFSLLSLVVLTLAALALVRSVNTGALVIGNLALKQDTTASSDLAAEDAIDFLTANTGATLLDTHSTANGYYATAYASLDPTNRTPAVNSRSVVDWDGNNCASYTAGTFTGGCLTPASSSTMMNKGVGNDASNGTVVTSSQYVILRMCNSQLSPTDPLNVCSYPLTTTSGAVLVRGAVDYQSNTRFGISTASPYFRVIVRTVGARNTVTFTETLVHY